jgi:hypothetical protein
VTRPSRPFPARYNGLCGDGDFITEGEIIVMVNGVAYHDDPSCMPEPDDDDEISDPW